MFSIFYSVFGTAVVGAVILLLLLVCAKAPRQVAAQAPDTVPGRARARTRSRTSTFDFTEAVDRAHQILPSVKNFLKEILIHRFLSGWYSDELELIRKEHGDLCAWTAVAHSSPPSSAISAASQDAPGFEFYPTMNIAFPDLSAEYYLTFIPKTSAPIFHVRFPDWVVYGALTAYDTYGLPIASVNNDQLKKFALLCGENSVEDSNIGVFKLLTILSKDVASKDYQKVAVNLFKGCSYSGNSVVVCRFYRPAGIDITPRADLPAVYLIDRGEAHSFNPRSTHMRPLTITARPAAFEAGKRIELFFSRLMVGKLREPTADLYGCQFFHPPAVVGCFPNSDAVYVLAWKPPQKIGMIVTLQVPFYAPYRPYYSIMSIDHHSTVTTASLTYEELGGWGANCTVFLARTLDNASQGGYQKSNPTHRLLLWGTDTEGPLGVVLRYIHIADESSPTSSSSPALTERKLLAELDGTDDGENINLIPGLGRIEYF